MACTPATTGPATRATPRRATTPRSTGSAHPLCTAGAGSSSPRCSRGRQQPATARSTGEPLAPAPTSLIPMDDDDFDDYDREVEMALYREYRDVVGQFKYVIETERRFYLANDVTLERHDTEHDFYFELTMNDVWVWDVYRNDRFVKSVRVLTFKDVNVEVRGDKDLELPKELALDE